jgi:hypothetical protein
MVGGRIMVLREDQGLKDEIGTGCRINGWWQDQLVVAGSRSPSNYGID